MNQFCLPIVISVLFTSGCGVGGSDNASATNGPLMGAQINIQNRVDFSCDMGKATLFQPQTRDYTTAFEPPNFPSGTSVYEQTWLVPNIGAVRPEQHSLKVLVVMPPASLPRNGVVMEIHGTDPSMLTPSALTLAAARDHDDRWVQKGYAVVYVARRGYSGSTGKPAASDVAYTMEDMPSQRIDLGEFNASYLRWHSASMVAALRYMKALPEFEGRMNSIVLLGSSLGADTALFTAAESPVFQAASKRAVIRIAGLNSQSYKAFADELIG